jgi:hypothetical protein
VLSCGIYKPKLKWKGYLNSARNQKERVHTSIRWNKKNNVAPYNEAMN